MPDFQSIFADAFIIDILNASHVPFVNLIGGVGEHEQNELNSTYIPWAMSTVVHKEQCTGRTHHYTEYDV